MWRNWWLFAGLAGFLGYLPFLPPELRLLNLFLLFPLVRAVVGWLRPGREPAPQTQPRPELPLPPPAGSLWRFMLRYVLSMLLGLIVPSMLKQMIRQTRGQGRAAARAVASPEHYRQKLRYRLPFDGLWYVYNGGPAPENSHSWDVIAQRYAYDFVVVDDLMRRWRTDGRTPEDYLCYGLPVLAPADGEVVAVVDGLRDAPGVGTGRVDVFTPHFPGNTVTIRHAEAEYSFLAHLVPGSICVKAGDQVRQGQMIGRCGHSGHSSEPHLHFHFQDHPDFFEAAGLPVAFDCVSVDDRPQAGPLYPVRGSRVNHLPCSTDTETQED